MSAITDVQRALNFIRQVTKDERAALRLKILRLLAGLVADEARGVEASTLPKQQSQPAIRPVPVPKSPNTAKRTQVPPQPQPASQPTQPQRPKPIKPIQPVKPVKPVAPK